MEDRLFLKKNKIICYLLFLFILGCTEKTSVSGNSIYLNVYGNCERYMSLKLDNDEIFLKKGNTHHEMVEVRKGPYFFSENSINVTFSVDDRDTTFEYSLKKNNYWSIGFSDTRDEFQFMLSDSVSFFNSRVD